MHDVVFFLVTKTFVTTHNNNKPQATLHVGPTIVCAQLCAPNTWVQISNPNQMYNTLKEQGRNDLFLWPLQRY
jgi:hypothetical protein